MLEPARQVLGDAGVYIYHTKINTKPAIEGTVWMWHQDYGSWQRDGCPQRAFPPIGRALDVNENRSRFAPYPVAGRPGQTVS